MSILISSRPLRERLYQNNLHPKMEKVVDKVMYYPMEDLFFELQQELESVLIAGQWADDVSHNRT